MVILFIAIVIVAVTNREQFFPVFSGAGVADDRRTVLVISACPPGSPVVVSEF